MDVGQMRTGKRRADIKRATDKETKNFNTTPKHIVVRQIDHPESE